MIEVAEVVVDRRRGGLRHVGPLRTGWGRSSVAGLRLPLEDGHRQRDRMVPVRGRLGPGRRPRVIASEVRAVILVGFMGPFTTFSTFISETGQLLSDSALLLGLANVAPQLTVGIGVLFLGLAFGRIF